MKNMKFSLRIIFLSLPFLALSCSGTDSPELPDTPDVYKGETLKYPKAAGVTRIVSYNVGVFSKYVDNSIPEVAGIIKELDADAVVLNEVDSCTKRSPLYQAKVLAQTLGGWNHVFGPAMKTGGGLYGNAIITSPSHPVNKGYRILLGKNGGAEERSLVVAECDRFVLFGTHLDHTQENARIQQAKNINAYVQEHYKGDSRPVFFLGDMNCEPADAPVLELGKTWKMVSKKTSTYPTIGLKKCIDFIFLYRDAAQVSVTGSEATRYLTQGDPGLASDHIPIFVDYK